MASGLTGGIYQPGARILGRYDVAKVLQGGMGVVYLCHDLANDRPVALKTFLPQFLSDRAVRDRFLREATMWVELGRHPHIVRAYRAITTDVRLEVYLEMELIVSQNEESDASLRGFLVPGKPMPVEEALRFSLEVARGMRYACTRFPNLVHRDLKPENILVGKDGRARVTDFGLATILEAVSVRAELAPTKPDALLGRTQLTHGVVGTPLYMAPEQWERKPLDARADIYALGCILFEMLAGTRALEGRSLDEVEDAHKHGRLRRLGADLHVSVNEFVQRCLALNPLNRYGAWSEVEATLTALYKSVVGRDAPPEPTEEAQTRDERVQVGESFRALGFAYARLGKLGVAIEYLERARSIAETEQDEDLECVVLNHLGATYQDTGALEKALSCVERALSLAERLGRFWSAANSLMELGNTYFRLGKLDIAVGYQEEAISRYRKLDMVREEGAALSSLGTVYHEMGRIAEAIHCHERSLAIARALGNLVLQSLCFGELGNDYAVSGDLPKAVDHYLRCIELKHRIGDGMGEAGWTWALGQRLAAFGDADQALVLFEQARRIFIELGQPQFARQVEDMTARLQERRRDDDLKKMSIDDLFQMVEQACRGDQQVREKVVQLLAYLKTDHRQPSEIQTLALALQGIVNGERHPDLQVLTPGLAQGVRTLLARL
jgi:tetratricopeptide (TPR) repeat protein